MSRTTTQNSPTSLVILQDALEALEQGGDLNAPLKKLLSNKIKASHYKKANYFREHPDNQNVLSLAISVSSPPQHHVVKRLLDQGFNHAAPDCPPGCWPEQVLLNYIDRLFHIQMLRNINRSFKASDQKKINQEVRDLNEHTIGTLEILQEHNVAWDPKYTSPSFHRRCWQVVSHILEVFKTTRMDWSAMDPFVDWLMDHGVNLKPFVDKMNRHLVHLGNPAPSPQLMTWLSAVSARQVAMREQQQLNQQVLKKKTSGTASKPRCKM